MLTRLLAKPRYRTYHGGARRSLAALLVIAISTMISSQALVFLTVGVVPEDIPSLQQFVNSLLANRCDGRPFAPSTGVPSAGSPLLSSTCVPSMTSAAEANTPYIESLTPMLSSTSLTSTKSGAAANTPFDDFWHELECELESCCPTKAE